MKQNTNALSSPRLATALLAAAAIFAPSTLRAGSCAVPDTSKWRMSTYAGNGADNAELENSDQTITESIPTDPAQDAALKRQRSSIAGLWKVTFYDDQNNVADVGFDAWHSDGTEILNDYVSPLLGNVCLGVFTPIGERSFRLKHPAWVYDNAGNLTGSEIIHEKVKLSADGNTLTGSVSIDFFDTFGNPIGSFTGGRVVGARIKP